MAAWGVDTDLEEYSASATLLPFDPPLPLLRGPIRASPADDPSAGPFVLAFRDAASWLSTLHVTLSKLQEQCEVGARIGCSISASNKCKLPWWKILFGASAADFAEREQCEEREMASCLAASKEACIQFAKKKGLAPFRDARIATANAEETPELVLRSKNVSEASSTVLEAFGLHLENLSCSAECDPEATNYRASVLMQNTWIENNATDK